MAANEHANGFTASLAPRRRQPRLRTSLVVAAVWAVAVAGGVLGAVTLTGDDAPSPAPRQAPAAARAPHIGDRVLASFGSLAVSSVTDLRGPASAMHLRIAPGRHPIQVNVTLNNLQRRAIAFDQGWFRLVDARGHYPVGYGSPLRRMAALSAHGVLLRFAIPRGARLPELEFRDPSGRAPVRVELGGAHNLIWFNPATHRHGG